MIFKGNYKIFINCPSNNITTFKDNDLFYF